MRIEELATEYQDSRVSIVLEPEQVVAACVAAARFYAAYGDIESLSLSSTLPQTVAGVAPDPEAIGDSSPALPIKKLTLIDEDTDLTTGEWALIRPLFVLYVDRENAILLEASRGVGADPYGRSASEVAADIQREEEALPGKCFVYEAEEI